MSRQVIVEAPGKVNLFLRVGRRRPDGYHEVRTVMQAVDLRDELLMELRRGGDDYRVDPGELASLLPWTPDNLARRAWEAYRRELGGELQGMGLFLRLRKRIPLAAGMGGGSADAAAVLVGLNRLCGEPLRRERLREIAARLGSDVPFFLEGGIALAEGRGERVTPLEPAPSLRFLVVLPRERLSTAEVYACFDRRGGGSGGEGEPGSDEPGWDEPGEGSLEGFLEALRAKDLAAVLSSMRNDLQACCLELSRETARRYWAFRRIAETAGLKGRRSPVLVSGSGPTLFLAVEDPDEAHRLLPLLEAEIGPALLLSPQSEGCRVIEHS